MEALTARPAFRKFDGQALARDRRLIDEGVALYGLVPSTATEPPC